MKSTFALALTVALPLAAAIASPPVLAAEPETEQVYLEARVSKGKEVLIQPHALVRVGAPAELSVPLAPSGPRFTLKYLVRHAVDAGFVVTIKGLVDAREVAKGTLLVAREGSAVMTLSAGGYTWEITGERMTPVMLERRRSQRR
jgi:hypothetical protein